MITCYCTHCGALNRFEERYAGCVGKCTSCYTQFTVPWNAQGTQNTPMPENNGVKNFFTTIGYFVLWGIVGFVAVIIYVFMLDNTRHPINSNPNSFVSPLSGLPLPATQQRKEKLPPTLYEAYREGYKISDKASAYLILNVLLENPNLRLDAKLISAFIMEGIEDSDAGRPMRYEPEY